MRCLLGLHRFGFMRSYRLQISKDIVHRPACERCGKIERFGRG